jgi:hypothetical protein
LILTYMLHYLYIYHIIVLLVVNPPIGEIFQISKSSLSFFIELGIL